MGVTAAVLLTQCAMATPTLPTTLGVPGTRTINKTFLSHKLGGRARDKCPAQTRTLPHLPRVAVGVTTRVPIHPTTKASLVREGGVQGIQVSLTILHPHSISRGALGGVGGGTPAQA